MIELRMPSVVEEWYWDFGSQFLTKWKIEGVKYKNEALQYFYTMGIGSAKRTILYNYSFNKDFVAQKYTKASECPHWAKESIEGYRQSAEQFVRDLMCIQKSPRKIFVGDVYVELNSILKPTDRHGDLLYGVKNLSDYDILKIIFVRNNRLGVKNWRGKPTYLRIVQDTHLMISQYKERMANRIIVTPEMKRNPVSADTQTGLKPRHYKVPNSFFRDRAIHDLELKQGGETEQEVLDKLDKQISILNQFMEKVNPKFYDTIREQLNIKYVGEEKPVNVYLQMARRRRGLEAEEEKVVGKRIKKIGEHEKPDYELSYKGKKVKAAYHHTKHPMLRGTGYYSFYGIPELNDYNIVAKTIGIAKAKFKRWVEDNIEEPVDVRLQMARRRRGLEAEGITTTPLLWAGATVLTLLTLFKRS